MSDWSWMPLTVGAPVALLATLAVRAVARNRRWLEQPGPDRLHARAIPRLGGVAMFGAYVITVLLTVRPLEWPVAGLLGGATVLVAALVIDDLRGLRPRDKLLIQVVGAAVPLAFGIRIDSFSSPALEGGVITLPLWLVVPATLFWTIGMMNAVNFMDGLDGLAAGVVAIAAAVLVVLSGRLGLPAVAELALALAAVALGFLPLNIYRASIIMGDAGSHLLGFAIATVAIMGP
ncbi:MAG: undecaprenyl/decaprenyl-phosphate alpha-N-acetylglucosaminyl 1-phosphate transferase, partial [Actinobacteria bacterium]|nr:undecaprenyl/decaprenyl-phosphate alpha-N-acetylglucosaminyl 1-phosphate transferase [Actinomycetota bacterium]